MEQVNGLNFQSPLSHLSVLSDIKTRSITAENPTGAKGQGGRAITGPAASCAEGLGQGWKISPFVEIEPGETFAMALIEGPGAIRSMWFGGTSALIHSRLSILRIYWDGQEQPSVECPLGDFFASGWGGFAQISSLPVAVNPNRGLNCFWEMPFCRSCRMTLQNYTGEKINLYYQVNYTLNAVPAETAYFHAQFRRVNPLPYKQDYTILDGVRGSGQYVGTYLAVSATASNWWGEGEFKFFLDGDDEFPTLCGTGTEDYFGGSYNWDVNGQYTPYTTLFVGMHQFIRPDGLYQSQQRYGMYRWHILDPIRFEQDLRVTVQALGWRSDFKRYLPLTCDMASVAYWYQRLPAAPFPDLPDRDSLEIV